MSSLVLYDGLYREQLLPLSYTRPVAHLRLGILRISEKWERQFNGQVHIHTQNYLQEKFGTALPSAPSLWLDASLLPNAALLQALYELKEGEALYTEGQLLAYHGTEHSVPSDFVRKDIEAESLFQITCPADLFAKNEAAIRADLQHFAHLNAEVDEYSTVIGRELYMEEGAKINASIINTESGPVYLGKNAQIMEGSIIRGPFVLCEGATVKMGAKIYGPTTIGPYSKVGGEIGNSVVLGYSNKGHDGYMGNSVLGEWCNLGADTNTSNLKNNYSSVKVWDYPTESYKDTGRTFHGLIMGDHSKSSINSMFNTGTVVGVNANIFQAGFPPKFVPSFSWGTGADAQTYNLEKSFEVARAVCARRGVEFNMVDEAIMRHIFTQSAKYRTE